MTGLLKLILKLLSVLPLRLIQGIGGLVGWLTVVIPNRRQKTTITNIALCFPELDQQARIRLIRKSLIESGKGALESSALWLWSNQRTLDLVKQTSGESALKAAYEKKQGVILALPHLGMWEIIGLYCSAHYPMTSLYRPPPMAGMDALIRTGRQRFGARLVPTDRTGVRALYSALNDGELIAILPDQDPGKSGGVYAPFFGIQAHTMALLSRLAIKTGATVIYVYAERLPEGRGYHIHFMPASEEINNTEMEISVTKLNEGIENCVRKLPEQYLWSYKRFRNRPAGKPPLYD
ncbi:MAG: lysophospholipid acyltransferase [Gammaproteobacteria bacterium]|nr:MAG: lysophospholipid acyltransferase [Gammaproteobacteria bacterium]